MYIYRQGNGGDGGDSLNGNGGGAQGGSNILSLLTGLLGSSSGSSSGSGGGGDSTKTASDDTVRIHVIKCIYFNGNNFFFLLNVLYNLYLQRKTNID